MIIMKSSLVILPACLLALAHLISAQTISTNMPPTDCEQVQNLSPECATALAQARTGSDQTESFCSGDCFGTVLSAYQSCGSGAAVVVQGLQEGCSRNSNGDICFSLQFSNSYTQAITTCTLGSIGGDCSDDCRNALQGFGCCVNLDVLGLSTFASTCGISSEKCAPATGGTSALHSIVGILTSLILAGLALMF